MEQFLDKWLDKDAQYKNNAKFVNSKIQDS